MSKLRTPGPLLVTSALATSVAVVGGLAVATDQAWRSSPTAAEARAAQLFDPAYVGRRLCGVDGKARAQFFKPGLFAAVANAAEGEPAAEDARPPLWNFLGDLSYPITTANEEAQRYFDQGLRFAHAFNHEASVSSFKEAQRLDPTCAMCYWGEAFALGPNINAAMDPSAIEPAFAAAAKAHALAANASGKEQALIEALVKRYSPDPPRGRPRRPQPGLRRRHGRGRGAPPRRPRDRHALRRRGDEHVAVGLLGGRRPHAEGQGRQRHRGGRAGAGREPRPSVRNPPLHPPGGSID